MMSMEATRQSQRTLPTVLLNSRSVHRNTELYKKVFMTCTFDLILKLLNIGFLQYLHFPNLNLFHRHAL